MHLRACGRHEQPAVQAAGRHGPSDLREPGCQALIKMNNPITLTMNNNIVTAATFTLGGAAQTPTTTAAATTTPSATTTPIATASPTGAAPTTTKGTPTTATTAPATTSRPCYHG